MPVIKNPKQEKFCQEYIRNGNNAAAAYARAGYTPKGANANAARLIAKDSIKKRLAELREETEKKELITRAGIIKELDEAIQEAKIVGQYSPVMRGIELKGKMIAAFTDKIEADINAEVNHSFVQVQLPPKEGGLDCKPSKKGKQ